VEAKAILERGSGHIEHQRDLLRAESERTGISVNPPTPEIIEKEKREYEQAERIVIPSRFAERSFKEYGVDSAKLIRIPYGVDLEEFPQEEKQDDTFRVVYAGRMSLRKGVHYLLKAFSELALPDSELWLLGKKRPEIAPFFDRYEGDFQHLGHKPQDELYRYYSQGSIFVLNSIEDGFGMVIPQAMACGLPAICTEHTGGPDIVRNGTDGFIIPPRDVNALKEKILWCYENREDRRAMGRAARKRVEEGFRWKDYGGRVVDAYSEFLESD
jgi:glycosyltransferase involved in cell wall biosynthesis